MNIMNKKLSIFLASILSAGALFTSCADLDSDKYFDDRVTIESVFTDYNEAQQWLAQAYSWLNGCNIEVCSKGGTGAGNGGFNPFCFADDMYYGDRDANPEFGGDAKDADWANYNAFRRGDYDESTSQWSWGDCYKGIYQASVFIHNIDKLVNNLDVNAGMVSDFKGQARFVRAYYYWLLLRKYGPVPILPDEGVDYTQSYEELAFPRNTYDEVAVHISNEMIQAAKEMMARGTQAYKRDAANVGRGTVGACLATRAIAFIYAASPLANGQKDNGSHPDPLVTNDAPRSMVNFDGTPILSFEYDESKWARAAAACKDVMDLTGEGFNGYELYTYPLVTVGTDDAPVTVPAYDDGDMVNKSFPDGYADIDPYQSYRRLFDGAVDPASNPELIFTRGGAINSRDNDFGINALVIHEMPQSLGGWNTHGLTQKICDAYYMNDGTDVPGKDSEMNGGDGSERVTGWTTRNDVRNGKYPELTTKALSPVSLQYTKREPRFYASVAFNGSLWECLDDPTAANRNKQIFYYRNGGNGWINSFKFLRTGIGCKKFYNPYDYANVGSNGDYSHLRTKWEPAIRFADILLMYAEALNELNGTYTYQSWDGKTSYTISRDIDEMKKGIRPVRARAGLPDYTAEEYADKDVLRAKIKRERQIEFMAEGKRYFDLRRWMDAPVEESKQPYGLDIFQTEKEKDDFQKIVPTYNLAATFSDKMYFWPISHSELKRNKMLTQNPGWKYND